LLKLSNRPTKRTDLGESGQFPRSKTKILIQMELILDHIRQNKIRTNLDNLEMIIDLNDII
jgi:hypothetical protein